jgi:hypothetical protein
VVIAGTIEQLGRPVGGPRAESWGQVLYFNGSEVLKYKT